MLAKTFDPAILWPRFISIHLHATTQLHESATKTHYRSYGAMGAGA